MVKQNFLPSVDIADPDQKSAYPNEHLHDRIIAKRQVGGLSTFVVFPRARLLVHTALHVPRKKGVVLSTVRSFKNKWDFHLFKGTEGAYTPGNH